MNNIVYRSEQLVTRLKTLRNEEMYLWPQNYQLIFLGVAYFVLQGVMLLFFIQPIKEDLQQTALMQAEKSQHIKALDQQLQRQPDLKANIVALKQSHRSVINSFSNPNKLNLLTEISEVAKSNNLNIIELSWAGEEKLDSLLKSAIVIELEGTYHDIGYFSQHIARLKPLVVMQNLSLNRSENMLLARIEAFTYQLITEKEM